MGATKSRKQVTQNKESKFRDYIETPFTVGMGILIHKETRSKKIIQYLSSLGLSIPYNKVLQIENGIGNSIIKNKESNGGVYIPENLDQNTNIHFAIDNIDFKNDTVDGQGEFHGTTAVVF